MGKIMDHQKTYVWVSIGLVVILILAGVTYNSTRLVTEKTIENHQQQIAEGAAKTVDLWLSQHMRIVDATAAAVQQIPIAANPQILRLLKWR